MDGVILERKFDLIMLSTIRCSKRICANEQDRAGDILPSIGARTAWSTASRFVDVQII